MEIITRGSCFKVVVEVDRNEAILAGQSRYGRHVVELDLTELTQPQREILASDYFAEVTDACHGVLPNLTKRPYGLGGLPKVADASLGSIRKLLDAALALEAEAKAKANQEAAEEKSKLDGKVRDFLNSTAHDLVKVHSVQKYFEHVWGSWADLSPTAGLMAERESRWQNHPQAEQIRARLQEAKDLARDENFKTLAQRRAAEEAKEAQKQQAKEAQEAKERAQDEQIRCYVDQRGTLSQKKRQAAGLLPEDEIIRLLRNEAFLPLDRELGLARYQRLTDRDVCTCHGHTCAVTFASEPALTATERQYAGLEEIQRVLPQAKVELKVHSGGAEDCGACALRHSYHVTLQVGAFTFSREYVADEPEYEQD